MKKLIEQFLNQTITAKEFETLFLDHWNEINDPKNLPSEANDAFAKLALKLYRRRISKEAYIEQKTKIGEKYGIEWPPAGETAIREKLFYAVDRFCGDPELFDPQTDLTEDQLKEVAKEALDELNQLS
jgi:hypothetical protein